MDATKKRILVKAISNVQHLLAVADAKLLSHRGAGLHDLEFADALDAVAVAAKKLADSFRVSLAASNVLAHIEEKRRAEAGRLPRPKLLSQSRPVTS